MQLASILSISCDIQHLVQQQSQRKLPWSLFWNRTFCHFRKANLQSRSHKRSHQNNKGNGCLKAEKVWTLMVLCSMWFDKKLVAEKRWEILITNNEEKAKWFVDIVSNGAGPSIRVRVQVQPEPLPNWWFWMSINLNRQHGNSSMVNSKPVRIVRVVSWSHCRSI